MKYRLCPAEVRYLARSAAPLIFWQTLHPMPLTRGATVSLERLDLSSSDHEALAREIIESPAFSLNGDKAHSRNNPGFSMHTYADDRAHMLVGFNAPAGDECLGEHESVLIKVPVDEELRGWMKRADTAGTLGPDLQP